MGGAIGSLIEDLKDVQLVWSIPAVMVTTPHRGKLEVRHTRGEYVVWSEDGQQRQGSYKSRNQLLAFLQSKP